MPFSHKNRFYNRSKCSLNSLISKKGQHEISFKFNTKILIYSIIITLFVAYQFNFISLINISFNSYNLVIVPLSFVWILFFSSYKTGHIFGYSLSRKATSRAILYLLVITFFIIYQLFISGNVTLVFANSCCSNVVSCTYPNAVCVYGSDCTGYTYTCGAIEYGNCDAICCNNNACDEFYPAYVCSLNIRVYDCFSCAADTPTALCDASDLNNCNARDGCHALASGSVVCSSGVHTDTCCNTAGDGLCEYTSCTVGANALRSNCDEQPSGARCVSGIEEDVCCNTAGDGKCEITCASGTPASRSNCDECASGTEYCDSNHVSTDICCNSAGDGLCSSSCSCSDNPGSSYCDDESPSSYTGGCSYGVSQREDYCSSSCAVSDGTCESGCGASAECDEQNPSAYTGSCSYGVSQREDYCSSSCAVSDGTCESGCGAIAECDEQNPGYDIAYCDKGGQTYYADDCSSTCQGQDRGDSTCRSSGSLGGGDGCTASSTCNGNSLNTCGNGAPPAGYCSTCTIQTAETSASGCRCISCGTDNSAAPGSCDDNAEQAGTQDPWKSTWTGDTSGIYCCGNDASEFPTYRNCSTVACTSDTNDVACCSLATKCVYNGLCNVTGDKGDIDSDGWVEKCKSGSSGQWVDGVPPQYSANTTSPATGSTYSYTQAYQFNITWTDADDQVNVTLIEHNFTGNLANYTVTNESSVYNYTFSSIPAGTYVYRWYANDSLGNMNSSFPQTTYVLNKATLSGSLTAVPDWPVTYPTSVTIGYSESNNGDGDVTYKVWRFNNDTGSGETWTPAVGTYDYKLNTTAGPFVNYSASASLDTNTLTISQNSTNPVDFYFRNSTNEYKNQNMTINYGSQSNATGEAIYGTGAGTVYLFRDDVQKSSGSPIASEVDTLAVGTYEYKVNITGNTNYTSNATGATYYLIVKDVTPPTYSLNSTNSTLARTAILHSLNWTDDQGLSGYIFQFCNGTWNGTDCLGASGTANWADSNCNYRKLLTFDNSASSENLANFPVMVLLNSTRIDYSETSQTDIRFYDADNSTLLSKETELWDESGDSFVWVKIPQIDNSATDFIWAYYSCSDPNSDDAINVWSSNYTAVYHSNSATGGVLVDSTNQHNGTPANTPTAATGQIDGAMNYAVASQQYYSTDITSGKTFTWEVWANVTAYTTYHSMIAIATSYMLFDQLSGALSMWSTDGMGGVNGGISGMSTNTLYHLVFVREGDSITGGYKFYKNGASSGTTYNTGVWSASTAIYIADRSDVLTQAFNGVLDEVRISNITRSASWVNASYLTETDQFITYNSEEAYSAGSGWVNDTWNNTGWDSTTEWSNVTKVVNSTVGANMAWCVYVNDTSNNWNGTSCQNPFTYTTTLALSLSNAKEPTDPSTYSPGASYQFNITACDDIGASDLSTILLEWGSNSSVTTYATINTTCREYYTTKSDLTVNTYNYKWYANDSQNNWANVVSGSFQVTQSSSILSVLFTPSTNTTTYPTTATIQCNITSGDTGATLTLLRNETSISSGAGNRSVSENPGAAVWNYSCTYTASENYTASSNLNNYLTVSQNSTNPVDVFLANSTAAYQNQNITVTYSEQTTANATMVYTNAGTPSLYENGTSVSNPRTITLSANDHSYKGNTTGNTNYTTNTTGATYYVIVNKASSILSVLFNPSPNTTTYPTTATIYCNITAGDSGATLTLYRNGSTATSGSGNISLNENPGGGTWNYSCTYDASENYTASSNLNNWLTVSKGPTQTNLLLNGTDGNRDYNTSDPANFTVTVNISGKTVKLDTNITGWTIASGTTPLYNYTTLSEAGVFNITGYFEGDANYSASSETQYANVTTPAAAGWLEVNLTLPNPESDNSYGQNYTFNVNATVYCRGGSCGTVYGTARYNASSANPDTPISSTVGATPFYNTSGAIMQSCGSMSTDQSCQLNWTINATGALGSVWKIGVLFNSSSVGIADNHTNNATITIISPESIQLSWTILNFGQLSPNTPGANNPAQLNSQGGYNITNTGTCTLQTWVKATDLTNTTLPSPNTIGVGNLTWSNSTNSYASSYAMTTSYALIGTSHAVNTNITTYYWLTVPIVYAGNYNGTLYICGNCSTGDPCV